MNWVEIGQMNWIEFIGFCLLWALHIIAWSFPVLFALWALVVFLAWLNETIKANGLLETILNGFGLLTLMCLGGVIVSVFFK
jgi:hypothetical protein